MCERDRAQSALPALRRPPSLSGTRILDTDTPSPAAQRPAGVKADTSPAAHLGGRSQTQAGRPLALSQVSPPYPHFLLSLGPARTADSVAGRVPPESKGQVCSWGGDALKTLGGLTGQGPTSS